MPINVIKMNMSRLSAAMLIISLSLSLARCDAASSRTTLPTQSSAKLVRQEKTNISLPKLPFSEHTEHKTCLDAPEEIKNDALSCWLWGVRVNLPDTSFKSGFLTVKVRDMYCTQFALQELTSGYTLDDLTIQAKMSGVRAHCHAKYKSGWASGKISATATDSSLDISVGLKSDDEGYMAVAGNVTNCKTNFHVDEKNIHFSGSLSSTLLNLFSGKISKWISDSVNGETCPQLKDSLDDKLTTALINTDKSWTEKIGDFYNGAAQDPESNGTIPLNSLFPYSLAGTVLRFINEDVLRSPVVMDIVNMGLNMWLEARHYVIFDDSLEDRGLVYDFVMPGYGHIQVTCLHLTLAFGDDKVHSARNGNVSDGTSKSKDIMRHGHVLDDVHIFNPSIEHGSEQAYRTGFALRNETSVMATLHLRLDIEADDEIDMHSRDGKKLPLQEEAVISVDLSHISFDSRLFLGIDQLLFEALTVLQMPFADDPSGNCTLKTFDSLNVTDLDADAWIDAVRILPVSVNYSPSNVDDHNPQHALNLARHLTKLGNVTGTGIDDDDESDEEQWFEYDDHMEQEVDKLINDALTLFISKYRPFISDVLHVSFQHDIRQRVNLALHETVSYFQQGLTCNVPSSHNYTSHHYLNFGDLQLIRFLHEHVNTNSVNLLMEALSYYLDVSGALNGEVLSHYNPQRGIHATLSDVKVHGLDEFFEVNVLDFTQYRDGHHLKNSLKMAECHSTHSDTHVPDCWPLVAQFTLDLQHDKSSRNGAEDGKVAEQYEITASIGDLMMFLGAVAEYDLNILYDLTIGQLVHEDTMQACMIYPVHSFEMYNSSASLGAFMADMAGNSIHPTLRHYQSDGESRHVGSDAVTAMIGSALGKGMTYVQNTVNAKSAAAIKVAPYLCKQGAPNPSPNPSPDDNEDGGDNAGSSGDSSRTIVVGIGVCVCIAALSVHVRRNEVDHDETGSYRALSNEDDIADEGIDVEQHRGGANSGIGCMTEEPVNDQEVAPDAALSACLSEPLLGASDGSNESGHNVDESPGIEAQLNALASSYRSALMFNPEISPSIRYVVPFSILSTVALFVYSNCHIGATVDFELTVGQTSFRPDKSVYEFSLVSIIEDMYKAGTYGLLVLIVVMSIMVPYIKLLMMLFTWVAPHNLCHPNQRERLLVFLEAIGKYALVDAYVLVIMLVAFRYHVGFDMGGTELDIDVYTNPRDGFYCFLLATISSIVMGHTVLFFHRFTSATKLVPDESRAVSLSEHIYTGSESGRMLKLSTKALVLFDVFLYSSTLLLGVGITMKSFTFEFFGLAGLVLEDSDTRWSLLGIGREIPTSVQDANSVGSRFIQTCYFFFGAAMPFTCLAVMFVLFKVPMQTKSQKWLFSLAEVANAWCALEVFVVSVVASLAEISDIATYIVGDICDDIDDFLKQSDFFDSILNGHDTCFDVKASIEPSSWVLFLGVAINWIISFYLIRIAHQALDERVEREGSKRSIDDPLAHLHRGSGAGSLTDHRGMVQVLHSYESLQWLFVEMIASDRYPLAQDQDQESAHEQDSGESVTEIVVEAGNDVNETGACKESTSTELETATQVSRAEVQTVHEPSCTSS